MIKINLLPKTLRKKVEPGWWRLIAGIVPVLALGVIGIMQFSAWNQETALKSQQEQLTAEVNALKKWDDGQKLLNEQQKSLEGIVAIKSSLEQGQTKWSEELNRFASHLPLATSGRAGAGVALKSLSLRHIDAAQAQALTNSKAYDGKLISSELSISGEAPSYRDVTRFQRAYESDPNFGIKMGSITNNKGQNRYSFTATVGLVDRNPTPVPAPAVATPTDAPPGTTPPAGQPATTPATGGQ